MVRNEGANLRRVVVCAPQTEYFHVSRFSAHNIEEAADQVRAQEQHRHLQFLLKRFGCEVIDIEELKGHPNSVFTRDTSLVTPGGYIKLRMGLRTRRGEEDWMADKLASLGVPQAGHIKQPGTAEGGDIILAGRVAFVGVSARTNATGLKQVSRLLRLMDYEVRSILLPPSHLHLGGVMSMVGLKTVLCCRDFFPADFFKGFSTIEVACQTYASANVICLGEKEVIADDEDKDSARKLERRGIRVHTIDLSEFIKGRGGPSCLVLPLDRG